MALARRAIFVPTSVTEAHRNWLSFWHLPNHAPMALNQAGNIGALPQHPLLHWSGRWGPARTEGEADFIPVQGGCVLSVGFSGVGPVSKLLLSDVSPISKLLWRSIERFSALPERS